MPLSPDDRVWLKATMKVSVVEGVREHELAYHANGNHKTLKWIGAIGTMVTIGVALLGGILWLIKYAPR